MNTIQANLGLRRSVNLRTSTPGGFNPSSLFNVFRSWERQFPKYRNVQKRIKTSVAYIVYIG
jgi:hypothetical protein